MKSKIYNTLLFIIEIPLYVINVINENTYVKFAKKLKIGPYKGPFIDKIFDILFDDTYSTSKEKIEELLKHARKAAENGDFDTWISDKNLKAGSISLAKWKSIIKKKYFHLQIFYLPKDHAHPPHFHHNLASFLIVLKGKLHMKEYDRIEVKNNNEVVLKQLRDVHLQPYMSSISTEWFQNVHWFSSLKDEYAICLNFNIRGFEHPTLEPKSNYAGRRYLDLDNAKIEGNTIISPLIQPEVAKEKYSYGINNETG